MISREGSVERCQDIEERLTEIEWFQILRLNFKVRCFIDRQNNLIVYLENSNYVKQFSSKECLSWTNIFYLGYLGFLGYLDLSHKFEGS